MKIRIRDVGLLCVGFIIGAVFVASLTTTQAQSPVAPASGIVATGPVLAAASLPPRFIQSTNFQWQLPPIEIVLPPSINSFDLQNPLYPQIRRSVDLIDTRYQPDIKLDDLK